MLHDCFKTRKEKGLCQCEVCYKNFTIVGIWKNTLNIIIERNASDCQCSDGCPGLDLATLHNTHLIEQPLQYLC